MSETTSSPVISKGLDGIIADETHISDVDGKACRLIYRGYSIDELVGHASYEEVSYLLIFGALPTTEELAAWSKDLETHRTLDPKALATLKTLPAKAPAMALLRTMISALGAFDADAERESVEAIRRKAVRTTAVIPTIVAAIGRLAEGQAPVAPKPGLGHAANFLYMLHGAAPTALEAQALDAYFVLLADHGFNASTFVARSVTSTKADYYSAVSAAVGALKGPLHGAANSKAMEMLEEIGDPDHVDAYVQKTLADHKRFMGFGHRVYKGEDPRAKHLKHCAKELGDLRRETKWFLISEQLQSAVQKAKGLYINVDFYSASLLHHLGIATDLFTAMFACARAAGWSAHILEQWADNRLVRPLSLFVGPRDLKFVPMAQRPSAR